MAKKLRPQSDQTSDAQKLRELIHEVYEEVSGCLLPYPGHIVAKNVYDSKKMDKKFRFTLEVFVPALLGSGKILKKTVGEKYVTGAELFSMALKWTKDINEMSGSAIASYLGSDESPYYEALESGLDHFDEVMEKSFPSISGAQTQYQKERYYLEQR